MDDDDDSFDPDETERLQLLEETVLRLAKTLHESFVGDPEEERLSAFLSQAKISDRQIHNVAQTLFNEFGHKILGAFTILAAERLIASEDAAAVYYQRILRAMAAIENTEPEPDEKIH